MFYQGGTEVEELKGYVDHIIFRNPDNGYTVFVMVCDEELTCVGTFSMLSEGENIMVKGEYTEHPMYGKQFTVQTLEECEPEDEASMERYLGSGAIKGIGAALAARIVRRFKKDTFRIIEEEPERLVEVKGISERKAMEISDQVAEKRDLRQAMIFLQQYGISLNLAVKIYGIYQQDIYRIIKENPYQLADDVQGVGFKIADEIAAKAGIRTDSDFRIRSGILYTLLQATAEGHTYLPQKELTKRTVELLGVEPEHIEEHYMNLSIDKKIIIKGDHIYGAAYYYMEASVASMLQELDIKYDVPEIEMELRISQIEKHSGMEPDEMQILAVKEAVKNGLLVITGGPGTGKTTTINTIIRYFESEGMDIALAAPTGRAAKRMSDTTGYEARTIHRMLELNGGMDGNAGFSRNADHPLETDVIIIDEMSMVDINLMYALLKAVTAGTRLILVGDVNQLPSVGPGSVLKDIIDSEAFPVVKLTKIFRQATQSDIIINAHKINDGEEVVLDNKSMDFFFLKRYEADKIINVTIQLIAQKLPKFVDASPFDIQVLTPMRKGLLGVERLNGILQQYLNPKSEDKKEREHGSHIFREGDKVMQTKNNYQLEWEIRSKYGFAIDKGLGVFNGDMGIIKEINEYAETMTVEFDEGRMVDYSLKNLDELELAYAITIHKSQGSEYPAVVIPLLNGPQMLMNRNLLYTAVTRAKKCVTLVGDENTFVSMIQNTRQQKRYTGLGEEIRKLVSA
ncbi:ATP-dependent RecD-like DNA helicase [Roseburia sp. BX1005]|uniref:ATP-dependent RecD2 DNA helicase n=1 Tax=Roseburia zhanii TaxID=2763064 RepID=A0A923LR53_9FIRM|nr:ATP-dependent RecD-like DNA helicase [Roseburia zhanii]MBC5714810.1 ATP-dependent RecD-like DNA helicase [Roseburia zhanii]